MTILAADIEFPSEVTSLDVDLGLINPGKILHIAWGHKDLKALEGTFGDQTTAMILSAPSDLYALGIRNSGVRLRGGP